MCVFFFLQLRWKPFEIPKTSQKKVDFVNVSILHLPSARPSSEVSELTICRLNAKQKAISGGSRDKSACICPGAWPRDVSLQAPDGS